jgi:peptidyl-prolyl cis-trans isomerase D
MTMLDRMRRHQNWLKWSLGLVVVAFILLYIPDFIGGTRNPIGGGQSGAYNLNDTVASVEGRRITAGEFRRTYMNQLQQYRQAYGGEMNEQLLKQLGIDQRILQQMIDEQVALAEADRLGMGVSDDELRERIVTMPAFQENGRFIGDNRYKQILRLQNPPMRPEEFEAQMRRAILVQKLRTAITDWITLSDTDVDQEFRRRNEKVKLELVDFTADKFREGLTASDAEIASYFDAHKDAYRVPEKRKIKYLLVDLQALRTKAVVTQQDVRRFYEDNQQQFSTPEQVKARHILLKTGEGKNEDEVKKRAEDVLAKAKAGADFAALAKQYSEDDSNAKNGGDLGLFGRGAMVKEFEDAVFAMQPGQISDLVKTQYGYHIIQLEEKKAGQERPFDQVKTQIEDQLKWERAQKEAQRIADEISGDLKKPADLDKVGKARGLTVAESGFFQRDEPIAGLGFAPEAAASAFELKEGQVSDAIRTPQGIAYVTVVARQDPYVPKLDAVKAKVRDDVLKKKAVEAAHQKAQSLAAEFKGDFAKGAKAAGLDVKTTELVARGSALPEVGQSDAVDAAVFALPAGGVTGPIATDNGVVIAKVVARQDVTPADIAQGRSALRDQMLNDRRNRFFSAYMVKAKQKMKIEINRNVLSQVIV